MNSGIEDFKDMIKSFGKQDKKGLASKLEKFVKVLEPINDPAPNRKRRA